MKNILVFVVLFSACVFAEGSEEFRLPPEVSYTEQELVPQVIEVEDTGDIPSELYSAFTNYGQTPVLYSPTEEDSEIEEKVFFNKLNIDRLMVPIRRNRLGPHGAEDLLLYQIINQNLGVIIGKKVAVLGSKTPWGEAVALTYGAKPYTINDHEIETNDHRLTIWTFEEYKEDPIRFDLILALSCFEKEGLGLSGDSLDPDGDIKLMKQCRKMLKPTGKMIASVPVGKECLIWNKHRIYGKERLDTLFEGWKVVDLTGDYEGMLEQALDEQYGRPFFLLQPEE